MNNWRDSILNRRGRAGAAGLVAALALAATTFVGGGSASAAPGDHSYAFARLLQGSLLDQLDLDDVAAVLGEEAESDGTATVGPNTANLDATVLTAIPLHVPGGIQLPLDIGEIGVVGQYALARDNGSSLAAVGVAQSDGAVGNGVEPAEAQGPMSLSLSGALAGLGLPGDALADVAELSLVFDGVATRASKTATAPATSEYSIGDLSLVLETPLLPQVSALLDSVLANTGALLGDVNAGLTTLLDELAIENQLEITLALTGTDDLAAALDELTTLDQQGVHIDLDAGTIAIDLDQLVPLNGLAPNTNVLTPEVLGPILINALDLLSGVVGNVETALGAIGLDVQVEVVGTGLLPPLNTTIGGLLGGLGNLLDPLLDPIEDAIGVNPLEELLALLPGELQLLLNSALYADTSGLLSVLTLALDPLLAQLGPIFDGLEQVVQLVVNVQPAPPDTTQAFSVSALRLDVLPGTANLATLELARSVVGPNTQAVGPTPTPDPAATPTPDPAATPTPGGPGACVTTITSVEPPSGPTSGGTLVAITGTGFTGATQVLFDGTPALGFVVIDDTRIEANTPPHAAGAVPVTVNGPACPGGTLADGYTYVDPGDVPEGELTTTTLPPPPPDNPPPAETLPATGNGDAVAATAASGIGALLAGLALVLVARRRGPRAA